VMKWKKATQRPKQGGGEGEGRRRIVAKRGVGGEDRRKEQSEERRPRGLQDPPSEGLDTLQFGMTENERRRRQKE